MDILEYNRRLKSYVEDTSGEIVMRAIIPAANRLAGNIQNRISREGKDSKGRKLSPYSQNPAYFTRQEFVKKSSFKPVGKINKGNFKNGKTRKSNYMEHGYKELREVQGRETQVKDLTYTGDMFRSWKVGQETGAVLIGFDNELQSKKRKWNEKREGTDIFHASQKEMKQYNDDFKKNYYDNVSKILDQ